MNVEVKRGAIQDEQTELIVVNLFEQVTEPGGATGAVDKALGGQIRDLIASGDFKGKLNDTALLYARDAIPAKRVLIVGLGKREQFNLDKVRQASAAAARKARALGVTRFSTIVHGAGIGGLDPSQAAQALAEGTLLSQYRFTQHKTEKDDRENGTELEKVSIVVVNEETVAPVRDGARAGEQIAAAVKWARDLVNQPANYATPSIIADEARRMAKANGLKFQALGPADMRSLGMGALMGVAQGSAQEPRFIILEHNPRGEDTPPIVLIGKGLTFDSGGISIKPSDGMEKMKGDMAGGAAVLGAMQAIAALRLPHRVIGLVPATENLPSSTAYKPGDVVKALTGKTIEVISTDAEGRLILADALGYAQRYQPLAAVDLATLTGACFVALGIQAAGLFSNDDPLAARIETAAEAANEKVWRMPIWDEYAKQIKSDVADMKNTGGRGAGAITAAILLSKFADKMPWAHLDIAGTAAIEEEEVPYQPRGATGYGVRLLVQLVRDWK
jgi:leucyl aminopeptidase